MDIKAVATMVVSSAERNSPMHSLLELVDAVIWLFTSYRVTLSQSLPPDIVGSRARGRAVVDMERGVEVQTTW